MPFSLVYIIFVYYSLICLLNIGTKNLGMDAFSITNKGEISDFFLKRVSVFFQLPSAAFLNFFDVATI